MYMLVFLGFAYRVRWIADRDARSTRRGCAWPGVDRLEASRQVYTRVTRGGWRIIGRTSAKLFDAAREEPFLLKAGDHVKFVTE